MIGAVLCLGLCAKASTAIAADVNVAAFANGALVESSTSDYDGWDARWITDEDSQRGWAAAQGAKGPFVIVLSLADRTEIHALEFDTSGAESEARAARDIEVAVSDTSASAGFTPVAAVSLKPGADHQRFVVSKPGTGRWLRLTVRSNHGDAEYTELMEFRAFGQVTAPTPLPTNLSGTYHSKTFGDFHLQQDGASLFGCYDHHDGLVEGGAESGLMRFTWHEGHNSGPAIMVLKRDGRSFEGWWADEGSTTWSPDWDLTKVSDAIGSCPHWNPRGANSNLVATALSDAGRVRLYGINFDLDSDRIRPDAKPVVDQLAAALKANPTWQVQIEGHTDATGTAAHNLELSTLRAQAVKTALVADGIAAGRLTTTGLGQTKPVASNDTDAGRAQNRRVEIVRK